ncbi:hypothetical protein CBS101457_002729 [Exobasidium rhododendri]|nr:hypothetical protein CBS101457_002729 [Exobasidium rhododendri]
MSLQIPETPAGPNGTYFDRPSDYTDALEEARKLLKELETSSDWESMPEKEEVELSKIVDPENTSDIPITRGTTIVEGATPQQMMGVIQLPGMRKKWDPRLESGVPIARYSPSSYELYSVMKSPSYFIWARDICAVQESWWTPDADSVTIIQVTVKDEERLPEAGSYQKSRTRATVELSAWTATKVDEGVKLMYVVKVHLNGSIPTSVVQMISLETPMCVGRVRDTFYEIGHVPIDLSSQNKPGTPDMKTISISQVFEDDKGEKRWTGEYASAGADKFSILFDKARMYSSGVQATVESRDGSDVAGITTSVDEAESIVKVEVSEGVKAGATFEIVLTPQ